MSYAPNYINNDFRPDNSCHFQKKPMEMQEYTDYGTTVLNTCREVWRELVSNSNGEYQLNTDQTSIISTADIDEVMNIKDIVDKARDVFGLSAIQVASIVGVSRPSLYNHMSSKEKPKDISAYEDLYQLATAVENEINISIKNGLKNVLVEGKTLLYYLKSKPIDHQKTINAAIQVANKLSGTTDNPKPSINDQRKKTRLASKTG